MELAWYRSWPSTSNWAERKLDNRPHVRDNLPRLTMSNYDYRTIADFDGWPTDKPGFCLLEFDVALDPWQQALFGAVALMEPNEILVAPYRLHGSWSTWIGNDGSGPTETGRQATAHQETRCDSFGLGCVYIPQNVLQRFLETNRGAQMTDSTFGKWYRQNRGQARVTWDVHPQHLHPYNDLDTGNRSW